MKNSKPITADITENLERNRISHHIVLAYLRVASAIDGLHTDIRTHRPMTDDRRQRAAAILLKAYTEIKEMEKYYDNHVGPAGPGGLDVREGGPTAKPEERSLE